MNDILKNALQTGKISGAYLIEGDSTQGIAAIADEFLQHIFCKEKTGCNNCSGCTKYKNENHPDVFIVKNSDKSIKIDEVRQIPDFVYKKAFESGYKAVVILEAHLMTPQAQNALLKILEEPPQNTLFVLGCLNANNILPTILSRCVRIKKQRTLGDAKSLALQLEITQENATVLLKNAKMDYHTALNLYNEDFFNMRENAKTVIGRVLETKNMATSIILDSIFEYAKDLKSYFKVLNILLCDIILYKNTKSVECLANTDSTDFIAKYSNCSNYVLANVFEAFSRLQTNMAICVGLNAKLGVEAMLFEALNIVLEGKNAK